MIDGTGMIAVPGFVDPHVHLRTPGREDLEDIATGSLSAAAGGFVTIVAMPNTSPVVDTAPVLRHAARPGEREAAVIGSASTPRSRSASRATELTEQVEMAELGAAGFSDDGHPVSDARRDAPGAAVPAHHRPAAGAPRGGHAPCPASGVAHEGAVASRLGLAGIPPISESIAVARDAVLAEYEGGYIHICHVSASETVDEIRRAKERGVRITGEVTPHHLTLTDAAIASLDPARHKMNPPLREESDRQSLIAALIDGTLDLRGHRPRAPRRRREGGPLRGGALRRHRAGDRLRRLQHPPGAHRRAPPLEILVRRMGSDAAAALGLPVPTLADGAVADVALIDPEADRGRRRGRLPEQVAQLGVARRGTPRQGQPHDRGRADRMANRRRAAPRRCSAGSQTGLILIDVQEAFRPVIDGFDRWWPTAASSPRASASLGRPVLVSVQYPKGLGQTVARARRAPAGGHAAGREAALLGLRRGGLRRRPGGGRLQRPGWWRASRPTSASTRPCST